MMMAPFNQDELPALSPGLRHLQASLRPIRFDAHGQVCPEVSSAIRLLTVLISIAEEIEERVARAEATADTNEGGPTTPAPNRQPQRPRVRTGTDNVVHLTFERPLGGPERGPSGGGRAA